MPLRIAPFPADEIAQVCGRLAQGEARSVALVEAGLRRISEADRADRAWAHVGDATALLAIAQAADDRHRAGAARSSLDGITFSVKDSQHVAGMPTASGSRAAVPLLAQASSPIVARLEQAGAIALGKTTLPEFSWKATTESPLTGVTRNPRYPQFSPGGSSGGAAVSVCQGACLLATGTDAAGSVRIPAAFTATAGFKPSDSIALSTGAVEGFRRIGHWGLHAASAASLRTVWSALYDSEPVPGRLRWATIDHRTRLGASARQFHQGVVARLTDSFEPPQSMVCPDWDAARSAIRAFYLRGCFEVVERIDPARRDLIDPGLRAFAAQGAGIGDDQLAEAVGAQDALRAAMDALLASVDVLVLPTVAFAPPLLGQESPAEAQAPDWLDFAHCTYLTNLTGHPSVSVPAELDGVPYGIQLISRRGGDAALLAAAEAVEARLRGG